MKNTRTHIGPYKIHRPELVVKLALVIDDYKFCIKDSLWRESEAKAKEKMPFLEPKDCFFEEIQRDPRKGLVYLFRYYTKIENRQLTSGEKSSQN